LAQDKISNKILNEAEKEREKILEDARQAHESRIEEARRRAKDTEEKATQDAKRLEDQEREKILGLERIELRKSFLVARQSLIDQAFKNALEHVARMPKEEYLKIMRNLLEATVESGDEEVVIGDKEKALDSSFLAKLNQEKSWNLKLSTETRPFRAGFVLLRGKVEINASLDFLVKMARYDLTAEVASVLLE
jgi:V/A-type H+-transporting ATPase subunit E